MWQRRCFCILILFLLPLRLRNNARTWLRNNSGGILLTLGNNLLKKLEETMLLFTQFFDARRNRLFVHFVCLRLLLLRTMSMAIVSRRRLCIIGSSGGGGGGSSNIGSISGRSSSGRSVLSAATDSSTGSSTGTLWQVVLAPIHKVTQRICLAGSVNGSVQYKVSVLWR